MILPSKHLSQERALLTVGGYILQKLQEPMTVSALWERLHAMGSDDTNSSQLLHYDGYVLALDLLYIIGAIKLEDGLLTRCNHDLSHFQ